MPPVSEVRTTFTIDLNLFAAGLKTMLSMTQAAGKQITPLLNMQMKAPDTGVFDAQLKDLTKTVDDYIAAQVESAKVATTQTGTMGDLGAKTDEVEKKTRRSSDAVDKHAMSLNHMKRESIEVFGGISFLVQSLLQLANSASGGDEKLQKMSQSMSQGVSAGFGLASMMSIIGLASGGTAAIIGGVVTVGVTLLNFFSNAETRAKIAAAAIDLFTRSLRGASVRDLQDYRQQLLTTIGTIDKTIDILEKRRAAAAMGDQIHGVIQGIDAVLGTTITAYGKVDKLVGEQKEKRKQAVDELKKLDDEEIASQMTSSELKRRILELNIQAEQNSFSQRRLLADEDYKKDVERILSSAATNEQKKQAMEAADRAHVAAVTKIDDDERQERDQHVLRLAEIEDRRVTMLLDSAEKIELATEQTEIGRLAIQERYANRRLEVEQAAARRSIDLEIKRQQEIGGPEAERKIGRLNQVLEELDKESGDKRATIRAATNEKLAQLDVQNQSSIRDLQKQNILAQLDAEEKQFLAHETTEQGRTEVTRKFALLRMEIEKQAAQYMMRLELDQLTSIEGPLTEAQQKRLQQLKDYLEASDALYAGKRSGINVDATIKSLPVGSVAAQLQKVQDLQNEFNRSTDVGVRERISSELKLEQQKLDKMTLFGDELVQKEAQVQEERRQMWRETHQFESMLINGLSNGIRSTFNEILAVHRQASNQWDAIWISMENTVISALADMAVKALENWIIDQALMAGTVATTSAAMTAIAASASAAATLVSIATFGGAAGIGTGAVLAGMATVRAASIAGFEKGGKTKRGEAGFIEGFKPEIIAPEDDFYKIARTEMIPRMIIEQDRQMNVRVAKTLAERMESSPIAGAGGFDRELMDRFENAIARLENIDWELRGDRLIAVTRAAKVTGKRTGLKYDSKD